jgi:hypothetical protein
LNTGLPAKAVSRLLALILTPIDPIILSWWRYSFFTLNSLSGWGVNNALTVVEIGP